MDMAFIGRNPQQAFSPSFGVGQEAAASAQQLHVLAAMGEEEPHAPSLSGFAAGRALR
jgi:hypothetical protein